MIRAVPVSPVSLIIKFNVQSSSRIRSSRVCRHPSLKADANCVADNQPFRAVYGINTSCGIVMIEVGHYKHR